ncbi:MAG: hypothetical protein COV91_04480 [Candidatus Taylorbacteria bacterium CG11_big_fil_rev_8_21_14_0_20_46_11]|uniref:Uncharacterized protein n=1 Tax=Candidatus Taylorbacteria bacterium CG11_big_fil_rev_8_21_14_0_20_46_11 TaxID=1975025 RepID=A0A2H0KAU9_9BACT|nr:MAG: hypothetical protein COV91_04480 [Candidatus Taylorbacteria bacterium CG11_big_fil_rev_8_21_14_0_20_46_11]
MQDDNKDTQKQNLEEFYTEVEERYKELLKVKTESADKEGGNDSVGVTYEEALYFFTDYWKYDVPEDLKPYLVREFSQRNTDLLDFLKSLGVIEQ